jgi:hypothetical protein
VVLGDVPHQPAAAQGAADQPDEPMSMDRGEDFGVVLPDRLIPFDT